MRISIFNQSNHNINIFEEGNKKQVTLMVKHTSTKEELRKAVTDRSARNRIKEVTDHGVGHWYYVNYKDEGRLTKHAIIFMNESRSIAFANYREGKGFVEYKCSVNLSTSATQVWNLYPENEMNELAMTNSMASVELTLEQALARIAELEAENAELIAQRNAAINEAKESRAIKARHFKQAQTQKNMRQSIELANGQSTLEERFEALDEMVETGFEPEVETVEVEMIVEEKSVETETQVQAPVMEDKIVINRSEHALNKVINPMKWAMDQARINSNDAVLAA